MNGALCILAITSVHYCMGILKDMKAGVSDPHKVLREFNRQYRMRFRAPDIKRSHIFREDWDNLILLDACRFDIATDIFNKEVNYRWSGGSNSEEFLEFNLKNYEADDTVWVTANPHVSKFDDQIFKVVELWDTHWDETLQTVPPESVVESALQAESQHPDKRIIAHFMQPHYPFIGDIGRERLPNHGSFTGNGIRADERTYEDIWTLLQRDEVSRGLVKNAYRENLKIVSSHAEKLSRSLRGLSVISSDHGNVFGYQIGPIPIRLYGHPYGFAIEDLIKVPWIEYPDNERKSIQPAEISATSTRNTEKRDRRLHQLGYLE